jgi:hypothetical protein
MKAVKFDLRTMSADAVVELSKVLANSGAFRIERGVRFSVVGESYKVWQSQNGLFVWVDNSGELHQGYSENKFKKSLLKEFIAVEYKQQNVVSFVPA